MKSTLRLVCLFLLISLLPAAAAITRNGFASWNRTAAPGVYDASTSDKLVVVVTGEHNFAGNYTGACNAVTYNGQSLTRVVNQAPVNTNIGGHGQTYSSIWYLDNPGSYTGTGTIAASCTGTSWVVTAIGLSGTLPGGGPVVVASGAASAVIHTNSYGSLVIAACGMGGQGNTASPLPGVYCTVPSNATNIAGLVIGSSYAGHAVATAEISMPSPQTIAFNTAKTDVVTVAAAFACANPVMPAGPTPEVNDVVPGQSVQLAWNNFLPSTGTDVWVDVWIGNSPTNLQRVVSANPAGLNLTSTTYSSLSPGFYYGRIDSYLQGTPTGTPYAGTVFSFEVSATGLRQETWLGLRALSSLQLLQREGIAQRSPDSTQRLNAASLTMPVPCGVRLRGLFTPDTTGAYTFSIAGCENTALWLSPDNSRFNKQRIAWQFSSTATAQWNKYPTQTSAPIQLQAGVNYYIEAQVMNSIGGGHMEIGYTPPGATAPALIPTSRLSCLPVDPNDSNENGLPDSWEQSTGLSTSILPGVISDYGDPDNDGISNLDEYQLGSNPLVKEAIGNGLTRDTWTNVTSGWSIADFTSNRAIFLNYPNETVQVPRIDISARGEYYASRYRGVIVAPVTGDYRFWIAGNKQCELWMADGSVKHPNTGAALTNRFGKQRIAENVNPLTGAPNQPHGYDDSTNQCSRIIHLVKDQAYYIEVLHKQRENPTSDNVSVAWQPPGQQRDVIPATAYISDVPEDDDRDGDFLPDSWESSRGLNPADNGVTDARNGQYGDWDGDGLTNLEEFQFGTDPKSGDTDGDGFSDKDERDYYHTNPLVSNLISPVAITAPPISNYDASTTGAWTTNSNGSMTAVDYRGSITYTFTVATAGVHQASVTGCVHSATDWYKTPLPLVLSLDGGAPFASETLTCLNAVPVTMRAITPWLTVGTHTLTILHDNFDASRHMRIDSIAINRLGGADLDEDGIPDWSENNVELANTLTRIPSQSRTSPVSIEGKTQMLSAATLSVLAPGAQQPQSLTLNSAISDAFYADVPLSAVGAVTVNAGFLNGLITPSQNIEWIATNLFDVFPNNALHIRAGDSMRLDAWSDTAADGQPFTVTLNGTLLADGNQNTTHASGQPFVATFATAGTYTLVATHGGNSATVTLTVHSANFGPEEIVRTNVARVWAPPQLDTTALVESDDRVVLNEITGTNTPRTFSVLTSRPINTHVIARLPSDVEGAPSAILSCGTIHAFDFAFGTSTKDCRIVTRYDDGSYLVSNTYVGINLPPNVQLLLNSTSQGSLFVNGTNALWLTAADFNSNGIVTVYYEWDGVSSIHICHTNTVYINP